MNTPKDEEHAAGAGPAAQHKDAGEAGAHDPGGAADPAAPQDAQGADTGANRGSPAAPVMKQFAKTKAESTGRP